MAVVSRRLTLFTRGSTAPFTMDEATHKKIDDLVKNHKVVLFMKGTRNFPQCGFSGTVTQILNGLKVEFKDVNVLADGAVRDGVKEYAQWPTIPQLYVAGKFVGGCDIVRELYTKGELATMLRDAGAIV
jgi:monothiol glutaredoxin